MAVEGQLTLVSRFALLQLPVVLYVHSRKAITEMICQRSKYLTKNV